MRTTKRGLKLCLLASAASGVGLVGGVTLAQAADEVFYYGTLSYNSTAQAFQRHSLTEVSGRYLSAMSDGNVCVNAITDSTGELAGTWYCATGQNSLAAHPYNGSTLRKGVIWAPLGGTVRGRQNW